MQTLSHDGLSERERAALAEFNSVYQTSRECPEGSALRGQLEKRLASLEIELGL